MGIMIIMGAFRELTIGEIYRGLTDPHREPTDTAFRVVREATADEYLTSLREQGVLPEAELLTIESLVRTPGAAHFYAVEMD